MSEETTNSAKKTTKSKWAYWVIFVLVGVIALGSFFGKDWHDSTLKDAVDLMEQKYDSLILASEAVQDSLIEEANNANTAAKQWREFANDLEIRNQRAYETIKRQERILRNSVDTSFISNARRISRSVDRYYQEQDSIKRTGN